MNTLYLHLRDKNPRGISYSDAVQLFLWLYSAQDSLPPNLRGEVLNKERLVEVFRQLEQIGVIIDGPDAFDARTSSDNSWASLIDKLMSKKVELDSQFLQRIGLFL